MFISSIKNPRVKHLVELQSKSKTRKQTGTFIIEGPLEVKRALSSDYHILQLYVCKSFCEHSSYEKLQHKTDEVIEVDEQVYNKIAYRKSVGGLIAVAKIKKHPLEELKLSKNPLLLVVEAVEKPGNIGALIRTVDAAGIDGIIICDPATDLYNPNVIRSSIGGLFSTSVAIAPSDDAISFLRANNVKIYTTALTASKRYDKIDFQWASAIVMGTESTGVSSIWTDNADKNIIIPMKGMMDSLNVSVSAAIVIFEAARQRDFSS